MRGTHQVKWYVDDMAYGKLECLAPPGADCRLVCVEGCESWPCGDPPHALMDNGVCNAVEWIDNTDLGECHTGGEESIRNGVVTVEWDGDCWTWRYAPTPHSTEPRIQGGEK